MRGIACRILSVCHIHHTLLVTFRILTDQEPFTLLRINVIDKGFLRLEIITDFFRFILIRTLFEERLTEAAEYLGVSYRHLQRIIARFCDEGILERTRGGYRLLKGDYLEDLYKKTL